MLACKQLAWASVHGLHRHVDPEAIGQGRGGESHVVCKVAFHADPPLRAATAATTPRAVAKQNPKKGTAALTTLNDIGGMPVVELGWWGVPPNNRTGDEVGDGVRSSPHGGLGPAPDGGVDGGAVGNNLDGPTGSGGADGVNCDGLIGGNCDGYIGGAPVGGGAGA